MKNNRIFHTMTTLLVVTVFMCFREFPVKFIQHKNNHLI